VITRQLFPAGQQRSVMAELRPAPFFVADDVALDFLNTVAAPRDGQIEWLANGADLLAWLEQAHAMPAEAAARFRTHPRELDRVAAQARDLREWFRAFVGDHAGAPLPRGALRQLVPINRLLERDDAYRQIELAPRGERPSGDDHQHRALRLQPHRRWRDAEALLLPIAESIAHLVCEKDFALVRKCEGAGCTLWFLDVSKGHGRRWCSMALCGNRAKAAAHRERSRNTFPKSSRA
jgi:predicted RNA-binding Zn ribbon-like protein